MKKNLFLLGLATLLVVGFTSCKKDDDSKKTATVYPVKSVSFYADWAGGTEMWEFTYDGTTKKITQFVNYWEGAVDKTVLYNYETSGKLILTREGNTYGSYDINAQGYITKEMWSDTEWAAYEYDANGYLIKVIEHWDGVDHTKYEITVANGNITKITTFDDDGVTAKKIKEFTYTVGENVNGIHQANAVDSDWKTMGNFYGKPSKNLVDYFEYWDPRNTPITKSRSSLTYEFDDKDRPITVTKTLADMTTEVWEYTYYEE